MRSFTLGTFNSLATGCRITSPPVLTPTARVVDEVEIIGGEGRLMRPRGWQLRALTIGLLAPHTRGDRPPGRGVCHTRVRAAAQPPARPLLPHRLHRHERRDPVRHPLPGHPRDRLPALHLPGVRTGPHQPASRRKRAGEQPEPHPSQTHHHPHRLGASNPEHRWGAIQRAAVGLRRAGDRLRGAHLHRLRADRPRRAERH